MPQHLGKTSPIIQPAAENHLAAINDIYNHFVLTSTATYQTEPSTADERLKWFRSHIEGNFPVTVALHAETLAVIGWAALNPFHARAAYRFTVENSLYVHHDHHRMGIGRALLADLLGRADALRFRSVIALISADQMPSIQLHASFGFMEAGRLKNVGHKFNRWLDVIYMQRENPHGH